MRSEVKTTKRQIGVHKSEVAEISVPTFQLKPSSNSRMPKKPVKPNSAFLTFIRKHAPIYEAKGEADGVKKASEMWCKKISPALRNKYEKQYQKEKIKYLADIVKYDEKMKRLEEKAEKKRIGVEKKRAAKGKFYVAFILSGTTIVVQFMTA